jgi:hypothetical protein
MLSSKIVYQEILQEILTYPYSVNFRAFDYKFNIIY